MRHLIASKKKSSNVNGKSKIPIPAKNAKSTNENPRKPDAKELEKSTPKSNKRKIESSQQNGTKKLKLESSNGSVSKVDVNKVNDCCFGVSESKEKVEHDNTDKSISSDEFVVHDPSEKSRNLKILEEIMECKSYLTAVEDDDVSMTSEAEETDVNDKQEKMKQKKEVERVEIAVKNAAKAVVTADSDSLVKALESLDGHVVSDTQRKKAGKYVAMDCEMVGVGPGGLQSALARISIVNMYGHVLLDSYVKPQEHVSDYRTAITGITPKHLKSAPKFSEIQKTAAKLIENRIVIGHALSNDFDVIFMNPPKRLIRDTQKYKKFKDYAKGGRISLKRLAKEELGIEIQGGVHSSVEDARVAMLLYRKVRKDWEAQITKKFGKS